jgi:hypothetical protein
MRASIFGVSNSELLASVDRDKDRIAQPPASSARSRSFFVMLDWGFSGMPAE